MSRYLTTMNPRFAKHWWLRVIVLGGIVVATAIFLPADRTQAGHILITTSPKTAADLAAALTGSRPPVISNQTFVGNPLSSGTFTGGTELVGFASGIILSSGAIGSVVTHPNVIDSTTTAFGEPGDADLTALAGVDTFDASILEFDFICGSSEVVSFQYTFASEEYNEFVNSPFNDVFGFFLDGVNIALLPDNVTPVSISTVNGGNPFGLNATNPDLYRNNDRNDPAATIPIEADGLTVVLGAQASISAGTLHHMKIAIADGSDGILNSWVFIEGGSFNCAPLPASLTVTKIVVNNDGGTRTAGEFPLFVDGSLVTSGEEITLSAGAHTVSETRDLGYRATIGGDCAEDGSITLNPGDVKSCTITNDDIAPRLTVTKIVINNDGGTRTAENFSLFVDGNPVTTGEVSTLPAGTYTVSETGDSGYLATIGEDCAEDGSITLNPGDVKSCTITNDDIAPRLTVIKEVVNDDGGTRTAGEFPLFVDGNPVTSGVEITLPAGAHTVRETRDLGYRATIGGDCAADGSITLNPGDVKSCTITNEDIAPRLTLTKLVINNDGGTRTAGEFPLFVDGSPVTSGEEITLSAGAHTVSETRDLGYRATIGGDCAADGRITLNPGYIKSCTITNEDIAPRLTLTKIVINNDGGTRTAGEFPLFVDGSPVTSGEEITLSAGAHTVSETRDLGYRATIGGDCADDGRITLNPGDIKSCTITNEDIAPRLRLTKIVVNDDGGTATANQWTMDITGANPSNTGFSGDESGVVVEIEANAAYSVDENGGVPGYAKTLGEGCTGNLPLGGSTTCTITNDDIAPRLTVTKIVVNNDGGTRTAGEFPLFVGGSPVSSGVETTLSAGDHMVSETGDLDLRYLATIGGHCAEDGSITLNPGDVKFCTITNDDIPSLYGRMTGGGSIRGLTVRVTNGFQLNCQLGSWPNNLEVNWAKGNRFHLKGLTDAFCLDDDTKEEGQPAAEFNTFMGSGTGSFNGASGATIEFVFTDAGESGIEDWADIVIIDEHGVEVLNVTGDLEKGNHQAHANSSK